MEALSREAVRGSRVQAEDMKSLTPPDLIAVPMKRISVDIIPVRIVSTRP
jgi:hypothetical protein